MKTITCKFGGSSLASADAMRKAQAIIQSDPARRFVVPSAPGKRNADDRKITDLLYSWHSIARQGLDPSQPRKMVEERYVDLAKALGLTSNVKGALDRIAVEGIEFDTPDYMASRGEYLNGLLLAELLGATFVDPASYLVLDNAGILDPASYDRLGAALSGPGTYVIPGFYGALPNGEIKTFSRGGSDVTGAIVARATNSALYENWTDVSGFRMTDPRIVSEARNIEILTYQELRELSYMGANVLHDEAIYPVREPGIPINIRNTNDPDHPGTMIVADRTPTEPVVGIAGRAGFSMIGIEKTLMNRERGFGLRILSVLDEEGVSWEHMPTGIDTMSVIIRDEDLGTRGQSILDKIGRRCSPDHLTLTTGLAMIATVGSGMVHHVGTAGRLCSALAASGVNIRVIDQGSSEMNIIVGVDEADLAAAVRAIYGEFAKG